jgi:HSP20 family protein
MGILKRKEGKEESRSIAPSRQIEEIGPWPLLFSGWPFLGRSRFADEFIRDWPLLGRERSPMPAMDVSENDEYYAITVELPGARKDEVHVELQEGVLTVTGQKSSEREEKKEKSRYVERCYGSFSRSMRLPADADAVHLEASFKDGVLAITIPKNEAAKPRTIAVKAG